MKKFIFLMDDLRLTFHWHYIGKLRHRVKVMLDKGTGCFNPELVTCSNKILSHGIVISRIWQRQKKYNLCHLDINLDEDEQSDNKIFTA